MENKGIPVEVSVWPTLGLLPLCSFLVSLIPGGQGPTLLVSPPSTPFCSIKCMFIEDPLWSVHCTRARASAMNSKYPCCLWRAVRSSSIEEEAAT